jgi:hypothetical protein
MKQEKAKQKLTKEIVAELTEDAERLLTLLSSPSILTFLPSLLRLPSFLHLSFPSPSFPHLPSFLHLPSFTLSFLLGC